MHQLTATIEFQMSLLLFLALTGYLLASRLGQPAVVGEVLVGLAVGPSFLGLITHTTFVGSIAHLGAIILLFVIGLEFRLKDILKIGCVVIGLAGFLIPCLGGFYVARFYNFEPHRAFLIGVALGATGTAVSAEVLRVSDKLQSAVGETIVGAGVIGNVLALVGVSLKKEIGERLLSFHVTSLTIFKAIGFLVLGTLIGQRVLSRLVSRIDGSRLAQEYPELVFIFAMLVAFFYAMVAVLVGLSAIVGSFIAGISLEGVGLRFSKHFKEGAEYLRIIFASIFFVSLGILVNIKTLTAELIVFFLVISAVAILTKLLGCSIPARIQGMSLQDSLAVGFGMVPRGALGMVIALVGLNQDIIAQPSYVALVLMSLLTTLIAPPILKTLLNQRNTRVASTEGR